MRIVILTNYWLPARSHAPYWYFARQVLRQHGSLCHEHTHIIAKKRGGGEHGKYIAFLHVATFHDHLPLFAFNVLNRDFNNITEWHARQLIHLFRSL